MRVEIPALTEKRLFYLTKTEDKHVVFLVNKNGSLDAYTSTNYAIDFHKELKRRKQHRRQGNKRKTLEEYDFLYNTNAEDIEENE